MLQQKTDANKRERLEFCQSISERIENNPGVLDPIFFSDEAHFHLSGHINKQKCNLGHLISSMNIYSHPRAKKGNSGVRNWQRRDCWALLFWRQWRKSSNREFQTLYRNATKEVYTSHPKKEEHWHPYSCLPERWGTSSLLK